jgi:site-specific recombinase XerD
MGRRSFIVLNRFFYGTTLGKREAAAEIPAAAQADPLPAILSRDEVKRVLTAVPDRKMRTLLTTVYAAGLRVSEVVGLQVGGNGIGRFAMPSPSPP